MDEVRAEIMVAPHGSGWLATAVDGDGETLAEATGATRQGVAQAVVAEVGSYLAGEEGWDA